MAEDYYRAVVKAVITGDRGRPELLSLDQGIAEQEAVIAVHKNLPIRMVEYERGYIPEEIARELKRMNVKLD